MRSTLGHAYETVIIVFGDVIVRKLDEYGTCVRAESPGSCVSAFPEKMFYRCFRVLALVTANSIVTVSEGETRAFRTGSVTSVTSILSSEEELHWINYSLVLNSHE